MGSCQPGQATTNQYAKPLNVQVNSGAVKNRSAPEKLMGTGTFLGKATGVKAPFNARPGQRIMAIHKSGVFTHSSQRPEQILKATEHTLARCRILPRIQVSDCRMSERLRMGSRRGGSRGRPATQRPATSPASSVDIPSE